MLAIQIQLLLKLNLEKASRLIYSQTHSNTTLVKVKLAAYEQGAATPEFKYNSC